MGGENSTEIQAPKRNQRERGHENGVETQRADRGPQGPLASETEESHSSGSSNRHQTGAKNCVENQTLEKINQREVGSEDGGNIQGLRGGNQRLLKRKGDGKTCSPEWKNQEQTEDENGAETQIREKRNWRGTTGDDGTETRAPGGDNQGQLRTEIDGEIQIQQQGTQNKGGDESQGKCRAKDAAEGTLRVDCSGGEGPPRLHWLPIWGHGTGTGSGFCSLS